MNVSPSIFRLYDIRGVAGKEFSPEAIAEYERWYGPFPGINITLDIARAIGQAYATFMVRTYGAKRILVGHEARPFADDLNAAFVEGITLAGCDVDDAGVALTPLVYFGDAFFGYDGAVNITGSHNVYFFNGFKMMGKAVYPIFGDDLQTLRTMVEKEDFLVAEKPGTVQKRELYPAYAAYIHKQVHLERPLKIAVDTGNGSAGLFAEQFFRMLGCEVISLYKEIDATFPNHVPDPEDRSSLVELAKIVVAEKADLGIGLDADGDRVGCLDEQGNYIDADLLLLLLAKDVLSRHPGKKILYDVKCSRLLATLIPQYGGVPLMHMTGHAPIKKTLHEDPDVILGGEVSGHMFFVENYFRMDDALYAAAQILQLASRTKAPFSSLFADIPKTVRTPELKLPCDDTEKFIVVKKLQDHFSGRQKTILIDGVRILFDATSWALVRASNTSPYLTIRLEADSAERLLEMKNILADQLEQDQTITDRLNRKEVATKTGRLGWV